MKNTYATPAIDMIEKKISTIAVIGAAYIMAKGQVVFFTACDFGDKYMRYFM